MASDNKNLSKNTLNKSRLQLVVSMSIFGTLAIFVRNISVSSGELALYRAVMAAILISCYLFFSKNKIKFSAIKKELPLLLFSGMAMGFNWILLFEAYKYTSVSAANKHYSAFFGFYYNFFFSKEAGTKICLQPTCHIQ